jgi:hypothetical protein
MELSNIDDRTQPSVYKEDILFLRQLLADMLEQQSNPRLSAHQVLQCKKGIKALRTAIEAIECQILA